MISKQIVANFLQTKYPKSKLEKFERLGSGVHGTGWLVVLRRGRKTKKLILKTLQPAGFGHEHFSDRAQVFLLAHDAYNKLPLHVKSVDVVGIDREKLVSVGGCTEFFILMECAKGVNYFTTLDRIKKNGKCREQDLKNAKKLSDYLVSIHSKKYTNPHLYRRRLRELIGHGECIMGIFDVYPKVDFISTSEIVTLVSNCVKYWLNCRDKTHRLSVVHGDFHPGNIWWTGNKFTLLDRSRGIYGEPADDVSCLSINYLFYALLHKNAFEGPFKDLFYTFISNYLEKTNDLEMKKVIAPFYAFRAIVIANPNFYPILTMEQRRTLIRFALNSVSKDEFEFEKIDEYLK